MVKIKIDTERCKGCRLCVVVCPKQNIGVSESLNESGLSYTEIIDNEKCTGCAFCALMCPDMAIEIREAKKQGAKK